MRGKTRGVRAPVRRHVSAGGVIFRVQEGLPEVALIGTRQGSVWGLPKGTVEPGEDPELTARREVREETGLDGAVVASLGSVQYWFYERGARARVHKTVHFYLMECAGGRPGDHDQEVEEVRWVLLPEAHARLSHDNERQILRRAWGTQAPPAEGEDAGPGGAPEDAGAAADPPR
ncbi:MAG: NUDIX hydrolase [candidate division NC10 bacterium]|nr:NUDIX hydrolase [candidate division NC10 bacterium]